MLGGIDMAILRHKHTSDFTIIPNGLIQDESLSLRDVGLLVYMLSLPDDWEFSVRGLAAIFKNDGRDAIQASLKRIEKAGYLHIKQTRENGRLGKVIWTVSDAPMSPCTDFPYPVKPYPVNPPQTKNPKNKERTEQRT